MAHLSSEEISNLLSQHGGDLHARDDTGISVILAAAYGDGTSPNLPVLNYLLKREDISRIDKIDAMEMAGAVILGRDDNHDIFPLALQYWRRALALRLVGIENNRPFRKTPTKSSSGLLSEWSTLDELEKMEQDPAQRLIQSLLVKLRISSTLCWAAVWKCFFESFTDFLWMNTSDDMTPHQCSMSQILDLSWTTLDAILNCERPHEKNTLGLVYIIEERILIRFLTLSQATSVDLNSLNLENLQKFVEVLSMSYLSDLANPITNLETPPIMGYGPMSTLCKMIRFLSRLPEMMTDQIRLFLFELVRRDGRLWGANLLHLSCSIFRELHLPSIRFLVQLGANPNARRNDSSGSGVLHTLARKPESENRDDAARLLLQLGAHLDLADNAGKTATDYWLEMNNQDRDRLPDWLKEGVPKLICLSSRVIRRHRLPYDDGAIVPAVLIPFVSLH